MRRMQRLATYLLASLALFALGGCSAPCPGDGCFVGAASLFEAAVAADGTRLLPLPALLVPANAELQFAPAWFFGVLADAAPGRSVQVVVRARHADGAFTTLLLGPTLPGDGSRPIAASDAGSPSGRVILDLAGPATAPLAARDLIALEFLVATLPTPDEETGPVGRARVGGAALFDVPPARTTRAAGLAAIEAATRATGARLELALRVPITLTPPIAPCANSHRVVALEADPSPRRGAGPSDLERLDRAWWLDDRAEPSASAPPIPSAPSAPATPATPTVPARPATRAGIPLLGLSALAIDLTITVPDHTLKLPRAPRPERRHRGDPRHDRYWEVPPQRDTTQAEPLRASPYLRLAWSAIGTAP